jgi:hypothetical protein
MATVFQATLLRLCVDDKFFKKEDLSLVLATDLTIGDLKIRHFLEFSLAIEVDLK